MKTFEQYFDEAVKPQNDKPMLPRMGAGISTLMNRKAGAMPDPKRNKKNQRREGKKQARDY